MKSCIRLLLIGMFVLGSIAIGLAAAQKKDCTQAQAKQADREVDTLKSWSSVYRFYKQFSPCDDGGTAEGVSDAIAKLLADHWDTFSQAVKHASNDKGFENFVVRHVDETIDWAHDAPLINENARLHCPVSANRLCKILITKTTPESNREFLQYRP